MRQELDDLLCERYPFMFSQRHASPEVSSMCWGFACGDAWFSLLDSFCAEVQRMEFDEKVAPVVITQVKSKLGSLRIHFQGGDARVRAMADLIRTLSEHMDEDKGYLRTQP